MSLPTAKRPLTLNVRLRLMATPSCLFQTPHCWLLCPAGLGPLPVFPFQFSIFLRHHEFCLLVFVLEGTVRIKRLKDELGRKVRYVCSLVPGKIYRGNCWSQVILGKRHGQLSTTGNVRLVESEYSWNKAIEIAVWEEGTVALMDSFHES